jgi:SAM-dependent methyltransferase
VSVNEYSAQWQQAFAAQVAADETRTAHEVEFLARFLPLPEFARVLDVPCGYGRHAHRMTELGYAVTGVDRDEAVVEEARRRAPGAEFRALDVRELRRLGGEFDAVINMWQSFGWFDEATNRDVLAAWAEKLRAGGRLVIDTFDRRFFETHPEPRVFQGGVHETRSVDGDRLGVQLRYPNGSTEQFEFQLFTPAQLADFAAGAGFDHVLTCADFDAELEANAAHPRFQLVLEHRP